MSARDFGSFAERPDQDDTAGAAQGPREDRPDPLRGSRTSGFWAAVLALVLLLLFLAIFILQNTHKVQISFLGWDAHAPVAAALLIAAVAGALLVACAGALRILQLRRRVKRLRA